MRRFSVEGGMWLGAGAGLAAGAIAVVSLSTDPDIGVIGGLGVLLGSVGMIVGAVSAGLWNIVAHLIDPQTVPTDGPAADYHDVPGPPPVP